MGRTKTGRPLHIATRLGPSSSAFESKLSVTHLAQLFVLELRLVPPELQTDFGDLHHMPKRQCVNGLAGCTSITLLLTCQWLTGEDPSTAGPFLGAPDLENVYTPGARQRICPERNSAEE